jgi:predicted helicase
MLKISESDSSKFTNLSRIKTTFQSLLIHDLDNAKFADIYAQTLIYGLFVARYHDVTPGTFTRSEARDLLAVTNSLLRDFFDHVTGTGFEPALAHIVDEMCDIFRHTNIAHMMHGLYQKQDIHTHDPVIHFYEDFLSEYDPALRMERGVFYTPAPVVRFIVRAVDDVLVKHFGLADGLADTSKIHIQKVEKTDNKGKKIMSKEQEVHRVQILDPATGTGTFLNEIISHIHTKMNMNASMWSDYVDTDLIPRLHGFELMMASYTIAHMKLGLTLAETGAKNLKNPFQIYLTNSLEEAKTDADVQQNIFNFGIMQSLTQEAIRADEVKRDKPVMIVVGNPPYSGISTNKWEWITAKIEDYKYVDGTHFGERKHWLGDDYVKFFRLSESLIERNGEWVLAFISNHGYLDNVTFRGMRWHLIQTFDHIYIVDLHGNSTKNEWDDNVFDIKTGTAIFIGVKNGEKKKWSNAQVYHIDQYGKRTDKYRWLEENDLSTAKELVPLAPAYFYIPKDLSLDSEYRAGFGVDEIFPVNVTGIVTAIDKLAIHFTPKEAEELTQKILNSSNPYEEFGIKDQRKHKKELRIEELREAFENPATEIAYRPFDIQYMYYTKKTECWINSPRYEIMKHILKQDNISLLVGRQWQVTWDNSWNLVSISNKITDFNNFYRWGALQFPLYLYSENENLEWATRTPNLDPVIWAQIHGAIGDTTPEEILDYIYAVLHAPKYREKYREFLKSEFPRIPYPTSRESFDALVTLGGELRSLHLMESPLLASSAVRFEWDGDNVAEKITYSDGKVYINKTQYFDGVSPVAWEFYIGWYQPAQKWLKDRKWRTLGWEDARHYGKIVKALVETSRVMGEVDKVLEV